MQQRNAGKRAARPLDGARLEDLALAYAARFASTEARLADYLRRKLRERGWAEEGDPPIATLARRFAEAGYVDDAAFARARSGSLLRRGYGQRRIEQALVQAGVGEDIREAERAGEARQRAAALALAKKRKFGSFGSETPDRGLREKQLAAMLRAGHRQDHARMVLAARTPEAAQAWCDEAEEDSCDWP